MPFKSEKQRRFLWAKHPEIAKRWADEYPGQKNLPMYANQGEKEPAPEKEKAAFTLPGKKLTFPFYTSFFPDSAIPMKQANSIQKYIEIPHSDEPTYAGEEHAEVADSGKPVQEGGVNEPAAEKMEKSPLLQKLSAVLSRPLLQFLEDEKATQQARLAARIPQNANLKQYPVATPTIPPPMGMAQAPAQPAPQAQPQQPAQPAQARPVGNGAGPTANPINSFGALSASGNINGNAAFGIKNSPDSLKTALDKQAYGAWDEYAVSERTPWYDFKTKNKLPEYLERAQALAEQQGYQLNFTNQRYTEGVPGKEYAANLRKLPQPIDENADNFPHFFSMFPRDNRSFLQRLLRAKPQAPKHTVDYLHGHHIDDQDRTAWRKHVDENWPVYRAYKEIYESPKTKTAQSDFLAKVMNMDFPPYPDPEDLDLDDEERMKTAGKDSPCSCGCGDTVKTCKCSSSCSCRKAGGSCYTGEKAAQLGLWDRIRAKKKRGEKPAKPGDKDYPDAKNWNKVTAISEKASGLFDFLQPSPAALAEREHNRQLYAMHQQVLRQMAGHKKKNYPQAKLDQLHEKAMQPLYEKQMEFMYNNPEKTSASTPAWQRSAGKNPEGGLNAKGRASYKAQTGGTLKAPVTESNPTGERDKRQNSFCSRMCGMKRVNTGADTAKDPDSRINKSLSKWNCKCGSAFEFGKMAAENETAASQPTPTPKPKKKAKPAEGHNYMPIGVAAGLLLSKALRAGYRAYQESEDSDPMDYSPDTYNQSDIPAMNNDNKYAAFEFGQKMASMAPIYGALAGAGLGALNNAVNRGDMRSLGDYAIGNSQVMPYGALDYLGRNMAEGAVLGGGAGVGYDALKLMFGGKAKEQARTPADREHYATLQNGTKIYRQNRRQQEDADGLHDRQVADFVDEQGERADPFQIGATLHNPSTLKYSAYRALQDIPAGAGPNQIEDAVMRFNQLRALVRPDNETLKDRSLSRGGFQHELRRIATGSQGKEKYNLSQMAPNPNLRAAIAGAAGLAGTGALAYMNGADGLGAGLAGTGLAAGGAYLHGLHQRKNFKNTSKLLKDYGLLKPELLRQAYPLLADNYRAG